MSLFLRVSGAAFVLLAAYAWTTVGFDAADLASEQRLQNVQRFARELRPYPLQGTEWDSRVAGRWAVDLLVTRAAPAAMTTLAIAIAAILLAAFAGALLALPAARTFASAEAYAPHARAPSWTHRLAWRVWVWTSRALLIFLRAVPEYVWAFIALAIVGPNVWAAVFALALHNAGILGKLGAEVIENLEPSSMRSLRSLGATRRQIAFTAIRPAVVPRFLLLVFYRWEACVREATVLGMLGIVSLGFYIQDARARQYYDVMFALILSGSFLIVAGDIISAYARAAVRRSAA